MSDVYFTRGRGRVYGTADQMMKRIDALEKIVSASDAMAVSLGAYVTQKKQCTAWKQYDTAVLHAYYEAKKNGQGE